jgi:nucleotide-binding universal stress UspA family protein
MYQHLLLPLDGSGLAEAALPAAVYIARVSNARVTLLHIIERNAPEEIHGERHLTGEEDAASYLDRAAAAFPPEVQVEKHVHSREMSQVARGIVDHTLELGADLVVMCTHGKGGLHSWLYGSIAQQVLSLGSTPVLLIQPEPGAVKHEFQCQRVLVPLDGNPDHEAGLPVAAHIGRACGTELHLLMVVETPRTLKGERAAAATLLPGATSLLLDLSEQNAAEYLQSRVAEIAAPGLAIKSQVQRGAPAATIVKTAEAIQADVIVLGTHGKASMDAFWSGSITPKISSQTHIPLLLVPVKLEQGT